MEKEVVYVFISHSHKDIEKVRIIRNFLEKLNSEPLLFFLKSLTDEDEITELIKKEIDARIWFIYCKSKNSLNSTWVKTELEYVKETNKENFLEIDLDEDFIGLSLKEEKEKQIIQAFNNIRFLSSINVSYSNNDSTFVKDVVNCLNKFNIKVSLDNELSLSPINIKENNKKLCLSFISNSSLNEDYKMKRNKNIINIPIILDNNYKIKNKYDLCIVPNMNNSEDCGLSIINDINNVMLNPNDYFINKLKFLKNDDMYNDLIDDDGNTYELKVITSNRIIINKSIINKVNYLIIVNYKTIFDINYAYIIPAYYINDLFNLNDSKSKIINLKITKKLINEFSSKFINDPIRDIKDILSN